MTLTTHDEQVLVGVSLAADRRRLERVARKVLDRDDAVTALLRAAGAGGDEADEAWREIKNVCESRRGNALNLLDLVVELGQQDLVRAGEPRTWDWPPRSAAAGQYPRDGRRGNPCG
jgi:hypothetical protein